MAHGVEWLGAGKPAWECAAPLCAERRWRGIPDSATWNVELNETGKILGARAADGSTLPIYTSRYAERAQDVVAHLFPGIRAAGADEWEAQALVAVATHECGWELPCWGDCRSGGRVVNCGSPGADSPRSSGFYQLIGSTARSMGTTLQELATSPSANHRAALKLLREFEPTFRASDGTRDFMTLSTAWGAGGVYGTPGSAVVGPWGVRSWGADTPSQWAGSWNAAADAVEAAPRASAGVSRAGMGWGTVAVVAGLGVAAWYGRGWIKGVVSA